jgi:enoyl-CoA hydratase
MSSPVHILIDDPLPRVRRITLNRPEKRNALSNLLRKEILEALQAADRDPDISVMILRGAGPCFSAGYDLSADNRQGQPYHTAGGAGQWSRHVVDGWFTIWDLAKPVIAQVHGYCVAAATMLALACDITLVSTDCKIRFPSIPIGGGFVSSFWTFFVGPKRAKEMDFIAGSEITGAEAEVWGFANRAIPPAELEARAIQMATAISRTPGDLLRLKKMAINRVVEWQGFRQAMIGGAEWDTLCHFSEGAREMRQRVVDLGMKEAIKSLQA